MGALFEVLNDTEKLACNFYFSAVSPDNQTGAGMPPRNPVTERLKVEPPAIL
jgi:hypothetical protein